MTPDRQAVIAETLADLEAVLAEPGCFGDGSLEDAATTLASEFRKEDRLPIAWHIWLPRMLVVIIGAPSAACGRSGSGSVVCSKANQRMPEPHP